MTSYAIKSSRASDVHVRTDALVPYLLAVLLVLVYMQGYMERVGVLPNLLKMIIEMPVYLLMMHLANRGVRRLPPGLALVGLYVIWTLVAAIYHGERVAAAVLYCRYVVYAYVVFVTVWATPLTKTAVTRINGIIAVLFVLQIVASTFQVFVRGQRVEAYVGTLCADGGAIATEFPLFAMALTVPFYLCGEGKFRFLFFACAFFLVGYASGKRAIYFLGPALYCFILGWHVLRFRTGHALWRSAVGVLLLLCLTPVLLFGVSRSHGIADRHPGSAWDRVVHAVRSAVNYTNAEQQTGRSTGRTATNRRVLSTLWSGKAETALFGWGPSAMREGDVERYESLMIAYGICGWARDVICVGWPAMLIYLLFHLRLFCCLRRSIVPRQTRGYWASVRFGTEAGCCVVLMSYLCYSCSFPTSGQLGYVYFYLLALLVSPLHRHITAGEGLSPKEAVF